MTSEDAPRVWDKFLTERDREHLRASGVFSGPHKPFGTRPVLLIVDNTYEAVGTVPEDLLDAVRTWPLSCGREGWDAIYRTRELLAVARGAAIPVVYTTAGVDGISPWRGRNTALRKPPAPEMASMIVEEIAPRSDELVIAKPGPSAFSGTPLLSYLLQRQVDTVIVCGNSTSGCVRATAVDAFADRFVVGVVEDCTFDRTEASHAMNLFDLHRKYAKVIGLPEAIAYIRGLRTA